jgi:hypothetical protein
MMTPIKTIVHRDRPDQQGEDWHELMLTARRSRAI